MTVISTCTLCSCERGKVISCTCTVDEIFKRMRLLQNQQENMCLILDALKYQHEIDHTHAYGWVMVVKDE